MHRLITKRVSCLDFALGLELRMERVLDRPSADSGKQSRLVVARIGANVAAVTAEASCERQHQE